MLAWLEYCLVVLQISTAAYLLSYLHVLQTLLLIPAHALSDHVALPASCLLKHLPY